MRVATQLPRDARNVYTVDDSTTTCMWALDSAGEAQRNQRGPCEVSEGQESERETKSGIRTET